MDRSVVANCVCVLCFGYLLGCAKPAMYSGDFRVRNHSQSDILIKKWTEFGLACPAAGFAAINGNCESSFPKLDRLPDSTVVTWKDVNSEEWKSQEIDLRLVNAPNSNDVMEFELSPEGTWSVHRVPE